MASPSQWEGKTENNQPVYIRYRYGCLGIGLGERDQGLDDAVENEMSDNAYFYIQVGEEYDGWMSEKELARITKEVLDFSNSMIRRMNRKYKKRTKKFRKNLFKVGGFNKIFRNLNVKVVSTPDWIREDMRETIERCRKE